MPTDRALRSIRLVRTFLSSRSLILSWGINGYDLLSLLAPVIGHLLLLFQVQTSRDTLRDAGRPETLVNPVFAQITFYRFQGLGVPLGNSPWAGVHALFTSDTLFFVHKDDAVFRPLLHGAGGARRHAPGVFTVKAGNKRKHHPRDFTGPFWPHLIDPAEAGPFRKLFIGLAMHFARMASDTSIYVLEKHVLAHAAFSSL
jgi:hypothetical protein